MYGRWRGIVVWAKPGARPRTCGTLMHLQGVPIAVISAWLGHADSAFTMRTYVHSQDGALVSTAGILEAVVTNRDKAGSVTARRKRRRGRKTAG
jgi:hypothetical protein